MIRTIKKLIPLPVKQRLWKYREDRYKRQLFGELAPFVPPTQLMFDWLPTYEEYKSNGEEFLTIYKEVCGLRPDEKMLDVGSGIGRKTLPLTRYFSREARYEGIDISRTGVEWCASKITPKYPNFRFQWIDVYNKFYNPEGRTPASEFSFLFADESFTFVMLGSVFTHMLPNDLEHYLSEVYRVMQKGGRCLISYFLLNEESRRLIEERKNKEHFNHRYGQCLVASAEVPEDVIAYPEDWIMELYERVGLKTQRVDYGSWSGREHPLSYQDLVLAAKK